MRSYYSESHINWSNQSVQCSAPRIRLHDALQNENNYQFRCVSFVFTASVLFLHKSWITIVSLMLNVTLIFQYIRVDLFPFNQSFCIEYLRTLRFCAAKKNLFIYIRNWMKINSTSHLIASLEIPASNSVCVQIVLCVWACTSRLTRTRQYMQCIVYFSCVTKAKQWPFFS